MQHDVPLPVPGRICGKWHRVHHGLGWRQFVPSLILSLSFVINSLTIADYPDFTLPSCTATCQYCGQDTCPYNGAVASSGYVPLFGSSFTGTTTYNYQNSAQQPLAGSAWSFTVRYIRVILVVFDLSLAAGV